jgi:hypothetical protein
MLAGVVPPMPVESPQPTTMRADTASVPPHTNSGSDHL